VFWTISLKLLGSRKREGKKSETVFVRSITGEEGWAPSRGNGKSTPFRGSAQLAFLNKSCPLGTAKKEGRKGKGERGASKITAPVRNEPVRQEVAVKDERGIGVFWGSVEDLDYSLLL